MTLVTKLNILGYALLFLGWGILGIFGPGEMVLFTVPIFTLAAIIFGYNIYLWFKQ